MNNKINGITLVEVLFSCVIITMVIVGVLIIFAQTVDISKRIDFEYEAANLAKSRIERARSVIATNGFDFLTDLQETDTLIDTDSDSVDDFKRTTQVTTQYNGNSRLTKIESEIIYKYRNRWVDTAPITMVTVFVDIEQ